MTCMKNRVKAGHVQPGEWYSLSKMYVCQFLQNDVLCTLIYKIKYLVFKIIIVIVHIYAVVFFLCILLWKYRLKLLLWTYSVKLLLCILLWTYSVKLFMHFIVNIQTLLLYININYCKHINYNLLLHST